MSEIVRHRIMVHSKSAAAAIPYRLSGRKDVSDFEITPESVTTRCHVFFVDFTAPRDLNLDVLRPDILPPLP